MKKIKQILAIILAVFMVLALVACSVDNSVTSYLSPELTTISEPEKKYDSELFKSLSDFDETPEPQERVLTLESETPEPIIYECDCDVCLENSRLADGVTPAKVQIRFIANESLLHYDKVNELVDISRIADYQTFIEPDKETEWQAIFSTDIAVTDFRIITISYGYTLPDPGDDDFNSIFAEEVLYSLDELAPELPLVATWVYDGCFTSGRGISFVYDGVTKYFEIVHSNYNSRLFLREFEPR